jgi:hypothetical protein
MEVASAVFELRTYTPGSDKLEALQARFRDHTLRLFAKHGMEVIGLWLTDDPGVDQRLIYLLKFPSRDAAKTSWQAFREDTDWIDVKTRTDADGALAAAVESIYLRATDFSPLA